MSKFYVVEMSSNTLILCRDSKPGYEKLSTFGTEATWGPLPATFDKFLDRWTIETFETIEAVYEYLQSEKPGSELLDLVKLRLL